VRLHVCATDGVFVPNGDGPPAFLPAHPITQVHLVTLTGRVRRRMIRWFRLTRLLDASAAADIRLIAFITEPGPIRKILTYLGEPLERPPVSPARGPPTDWREFGEALCRP